MAEVNQSSIFLPVLLIIGLTAIAFGRLAVARGRAAKQRCDSAEYYRAFQGAAEPEYAVIAVRHYANMFEVPILFYTGAIIAFSLNAVSIYTIVFAWGYALARTAQSTIHLTYNNSMHRGLCFMVGWIFIIAFWISFTGAIW